MTEPVWGPAEVPRDHNGRPKVKPLGAGPGVLPKEKLTAYTRCTKYVSALEDTYGLDLWHQRKVAEGLAARPDLLLRVNSLGPEPDKRQNEAAFKRWKAAMDATAKEALTAARADAKATVGTSLHQLTERIDLGEPNVIAQATPEYRPHLEAYVKATEKFRHVYIEKFTVQDDLQVGGTPDRVSEIEGEDGLFIADLKTGNVEYGLGKMAMQLAVYSRSLLYDPTTQERRPYASAVNQDRGLIIALDAESAVVKLLWLDLAAGWEAVLLARQVRAWRSGEKALATPYGPPVQIEAAPAALTSTAGAALLSAIDNAQEPAQLIQLWQEYSAAGAWTADHTARAAARKAQLQAA